jgi:predicted AlkP superfamily phosphohydrolase/phosphomutase
MKSVLPPVTSPNWKCFSTGKNPGKIGIFWWENIDWNKRMVFYPTARKTMNNELWDYLSDAGLRVGVLGMPTSHPPKRVDGFFVSGRPDAPDSGFAYPSELENELRTAGWKFGPAHHLDLQRDKAAAEIHEIIDMHFQTAKRLAEYYNVDFFMEATFHINSLHHFLWDSPETKRGWEIIDKHIGELLETEANLILMSDHGSNRIDTVFNINTWLQKEGYLKLHNRIGDFLNRLGINQRSLHKVVSGLRLTGHLGNVMPRNLYGNIPTESGEIRRESKTGKVDWERSRAFASGQGPIYLNPKNPNNTALKSEVKQKLEALIDPLTGSKVIERVYAREEIYHGKYLQEAPDLVIDQAKGVHIPGGIGQRDVFDSPRRWRAENKKFGLFMAYGPDIEQAGKIQNVSILDLAPTILHLMGLEIPSDMDGGVLKEIFRKGSQPHSRAVIFKKLQAEERGNIRGKIGSLKTQRKI